MKEFINKISRGSKVILFLEVLLLVQIFLIVVLCIRNENVDLDEYCSSHGYHHGSDIVTVNGVN